MSTREKATRSRRGGGAPKALLSQPTALNLYPSDLDKIETAITFLRSKGCDRVTKSRVGQLALQELQLNDQTVAAFHQLPDYRGRKK